MKKAYQFLGWNSIQIGFGELLSDRTQWSPLTLDWDPEGIRNCSYAQRPERIGITAQDRSDKRHLLAVYDCYVGSTRFVLRLDYVLHHSFDRSGSRICYTVPSKERGKADLYLYSFEGGSSHLLVEAALAQDTVPSWLPDDGSIVYHSADGQVEILGLSNGQREVLVEGHSPVVSPDGTLVAFYRADEIYIWNISRRSASLLPTKRRLRKRQLTNGFSWSDDGRYLSFGATTGFVGKETTFFLAEVSSRHLRKIEVEYLSGLTLIGASQAA